MKYFLDSAKLEEIDCAYRTFGIDGVTTNPRHVANSGRSFKEVVTGISAWVKENGLEGKENFPVSVEINPHLEKKDDMVAAAKEIAALSDNFVIKIPCTEEGIAAARELEKAGVRTNLTLVFSAAQAIIAAKIGCMFVSPFIGWKEDNGENCRDYIEDITSLYSNYDWLGRTEIICAAVRTPKQIVDCAVAGADIVTAGLAVFKNSFAHPYTRQGIELFCSAWDDTKKDEG